MPEAYYQHLKCLKCDHEFLTPIPESCPECGYVYLEWLNYDPKDFKDEE